jgi:hypothetical protein
MPQETAQMSLRPFLFAILAPCHAMKVSQTSMSPSCRPAFLAQAERVKAAGSWGTRELMLTFTYPYSIAVGHVDAGWTQEEIARKLAVRITTARLGGPINVIGDEKRDEA